LVRAITAGGRERDSARVCELSGRMDLSAWPEGSRLIVRRERPHPGAQFMIFDEHGYRHTCLLTDQDGELTTAEPKRLRQRILHVAAKFVRHGRSTQLKLDRDWP
jgi:hypothetical protein